MRATELPETETETENETGTQAEAEGEAGAESGPEAEAEAEAGAKAETEAWIICAAPLARTVGHSRDSSTSDHERNEAARDRD
jgi:hypothetical protein